MMFKKLLVSVTLGALLIASLSLWAKGSQELVEEPVTIQEPILVATLQVENQLSISEYQGGQEGYLDQVSTSKAKRDHQTGEVGLSFSATSSIWIMAFGLLFFVIRGATRRIK